MGGHFVVCAWLSFGGAVALQARRPRGALPRKKAKPKGEEEEGGDLSMIEDRYEEWSVDVAAFEATKSDPLVYVDRSPGAGRGTTVTEYVGCLAAAPEARCDELELQQAFYGENWRKYSQRYEIGLSASRVVDAAGAAEGGTLFVSESGADLSEVESCNVDEGLEACLVRSGKGDFVLLGKVPAQGASPAEGVAQLINDHTALRAPRRAAASSSEGGATEAEAEAGDDGDGGVIDSRDVDSFILSSSNVPVATHLEALYASVDEYVARIEPLTNVALVQAKPAGGIASTRVFAVATRAIGQGQELRLTYGVEWWLDQLRRAALAQLVTCAPDPVRKAALVEVIRDIERVSCDRLQAQARAIGRAGAMPRSYAAPLEKFPLLDALLDDGDEDSWRKAILSEEFATVTECPLDHVYSDTFVGTF